MKFLFSSVVAAVLLGGCGPGSPDAEPGAVASDTASPGGTDTTAPADSPSTGGSNRAWTVSTSGIGPVNAGMTLAEAAAAAGAEAEDPTPGAECRYVTFAGVPEGVAFMVIADTVRRVDVRAATLATDRGARAGDTAASVRELYGDNLETMPHKYTPGGQYLIASSPDSLSRLVFETESDTVRQIRAGLMPEVLWVEGCG